MSFDWTDTRIECLKKLWKDGLSASQIAVEISEPRDKLSRSAVIGKVHRLGLSGRVKTPAAPRVPPRPRRVPSPHGNAQRNPTVKRVSNHGTRFEVKDVAAPDPFEARVADVVPLHISILQLNDETCRYPYGDGTDETPVSFCGNPPVKDSPYCGPHKAICEVHPTNRREISDEESARRSASAKPRPAEVA